MEKEENGKLPYLDMLIIRDKNKILTEWHTRDISSGRIINFHSTQNSKHENQHIKKPT